MERGQTEPPPPPFRFSIKRKELPFDPSPSPSPFTVNIGSDDLSLSEWDAEIPRLIKDMLKGRGVSNKRGIASNQIRPVVVGGRGGQGIVSAALLAWGISGGRH
ncbi:hypothetical protein CEXT_574781 [Caerostris extrusa]|uniref:Uncharacterized protein n=1 Tax=Caerostris extrusa TaxID=172846 RepID=A0AAV4Y8N3_CAEEX|nr:hypothetical protein CEXT_574781 [Caerostris extrusa]